MSDIECVEIPSLYAVLKERNNVTFLHTPCIELVYQIVGMDVTISLTFLKDKKPSIEDIQSSLLSFITRKILKGY